MFKPAHLAMASLALAAVCSLPALAQGADKGGPDGKGGPHRPAFGDIDTNHDGVISQAEFEAFKPKRPEGPEGGPPPRDGGPRDHHHFRGPPDLKSLDTNGDGKVTLEEFSAPMKEHFARLDTNHDGVLSADELKAGPGGPDGPPPPPQN